MASKNKKVPNFIFKMRRNRGLAQKQLAWLLGHQQTRMISKYEHGSSLPPLETAMLLEISLGVRLSELYVELYQELEHTVLMRANDLHPDLRRALRGRLLGKDDDEHSGQGRAVHGGIPSKDAA